VRSGCDKFRLRQPAALLMRQLGNTPDAWWGAISVATGSHMIRHRKKALSPGARVMWSRAGRTAEGVVRKVFTHRLERTMKGAIVTQEACKRDPAYLIEQDDGDTLLKSHSELQLVA
jgi:hypothetical protein